MFFASQWWCIFCVLHPFRDPCPRTSSSSLAAVKSFQTTKRTLHAFSCISVQFIVLISFLSGVSYKVLKNCRHHWSPPCAHRDSVQWGWFWWSRPVRCCASTFLTWMGHCWYRWWASTGLSLHTGQRVKGHCWPPAFERACSCALKLKKKLLW